MKRATTWPCDRCGQTVTKRRRQGRPNLCKPCAAQAVEAAANEMADKSGPAWERWQAAMVAVVEREAGQAS